MAVLCLVLSILAQAQYLSCRASSYNPPPNIPAAYYQCMEARPEDLEKAYFSNYGNRTLAEMNYNGQLFVFKNLCWSEDWRLQLQQLGHIWISCIKCIPADPEAVAQLKPDTIIDVVGLNTGVPADPTLGWSLVMTDCYFLPAGSIALPASGGATFAPGY